MARRSDGLVLRQVRTLFNLGVIGELTDGQLLERFATAGGEAAELAFAALVERHGPMVLRIGRNVLSDPNDVEDAFQATFLVLVQRSRSLWVEDSLGPWLHRVARRIAVRARANAARRREQERRAAEGRPERVPAANDDGLTALLHEEIDRLPERCRVPVLLCDIEGLTHEQAARHLSWPIGTVKSRLMSGRDRLRARLVRRGVAPAVALMKVAMTTPARSASAAVPAGLVEATARAAGQIAAGAGATMAGAVPATVALLMEGALSTMFMTRIKFAVLACGLIAGGAVVAAQQAGRTHEAPPQPASATTAVATRPDGTEDDEAAMAREMAGLELGLLEDEVSQLRVQVQNARQNRIRLEMESSRGDRSGRELVRAARDAYDLSVQAYLEKARELASRRRRACRADEPRRAEREADGPATHASTAAVGSIDMDAVFKRYAKVVEAHRRYAAEADSQQARQRLLQADAEELAARMQKLAPGSTDYVATEAHLASLRRQTALERDAAEKKLMSDQTRGAAGLLDEIQRTIADIAKAKGFDYVVRAEAVPQPDASHNDVMTALKRSVLYANPRNDITEEVIRELNRRYEVDSNKTSR